MKHIWVMIAVLSLIFLSACAEQEQLPVVDLTQSQDNFITVTVEKGQAEGVFGTETHVLESPTEDLYDKWQRTQPQKLAQDKFDAFVNLHHDIEIDADISDDFFACDEDVDFVVDVRVENRENADEEDVVIRLKNDDLNILSEKVVDVPPYEVRTVRFPFQFNDVASGSYELEATVFRDNGDFEGRDSDTLRIGVCLN